MISFLFGVVVGAGGFWLYRMLAPEGSSGQGGMLGSLGGLGGGSIQRPSPTEVHGRPSEPIPGPETEAAGAERAVGPRTGT